VSRIINRYKDRKTTARKKGSGRSQVIKKSEKQSIHNTLKRHPQMSCDDLIEELEDCSPETMRRSLHTMKFHFKNPDIKPELNDLDRLLRFHWADFNCQCDFAPVVFVDESTFQLGFNKNRCWLPAGYAPLEQNPHPLKVNVCAAIGLFGKVMIDVYRQNTDSKVYIKILKHQLIPMANEIYQEWGYNWVLVQDNARYHTSKEVEIFFKKNGIETLPFPPYSPDLNPLENLWALLKHNVYKREPTSLDELERFIYEEWESISDDDIGSYVSSINRRMCETISVLGDSIPY